MDIKDLRFNYKKDRINFNSLEKNPIVLFLDWFNEAIKLKEYEANACVLSTVNNHNVPSSRVVLLKGVSDVGFIFFTNYTSIKADDISKNSNVALNFFWPYFERQIRIQGVASKLSDQDSKEYFSSRPRKSQIGAWVSKQSDTISLDHDFSIDIERIEKRFFDKEVRKPSEWGGYCVIPNRIEFWQGRPSRLHDRLLYTKEDENWIINRLSP
tara:strand:+ start:66 stop:701 length:636 start_codon:yes stop_codon:yes gene_type:complete